MEWPAVAGSVEFDEFEDSGKYAERVLKSFLSFHRNDIRVSFFDAFLYSLMFTPEEKRSSWKKKSKMFWGRNFTKTSVTVKSFWGKTIL